MAKFELYRGTGHRRRKVDTFDNPADPLDARACERLLADQADAHDIPRSEAELVSYPRGRSPRKYRTTS